MKRDIFDLEKEFEKLRRQMDFLFGSIFSPFESKLIENKNSHYLTNYNNSSDLIDERLFKVPSADVYETDKEIVIQAEIPGINKEDINLEIQDNKLILKAEKKFEKKDEDNKKGYFRIERSYSNFYREFKLPNNINESEIKASYNNGVLEVHIPKIENKERKGKFINID